MIQRTTPPAIRVTGLSKAYTIQHGKENQSTLAEQALSWARNPFRRAEKETFHALKDIDLEIQQGDIVGIIGRNGAGKSTLLKVLSRITPPTAGKVELFGRVGSLLEVGTGFHPELSGRENVYLNGAILGMTRPEIRKQFDAIVDFAGVEKFLDTPVKRYSSGMYVRLAFAVAAHMRTEILIVDEVLAVGDAEFQKKCLGKMQDVAQGEGRTVLFVSHNLSSVENLCRATVVLAHGQLQCFTDTEHAIDSYLKSRSSEPYVNTAHGRTRDHVETFNIWSGGKKCNAVSIGDELTFQVQLAPKSSSLPCEVGVIIKDRFGQRVASVHSRYNSNLEIRRDRRMVVSCRVHNVMLAPDVYDIEVAVGDGHNVLERCEFAQAIEIIGSDIYGTGCVPTSQQGHSVLMADWEASHND